MCSIRRFLALVIALMCSAALHAEEKCTLKIVASLDLIDNPGGTPMVAVTFDGRPAKMILDTGAYWSGITPSAAAGLKTRSLDYIGAVGAGGGTMRTAAKVPSLQIGKLMFEDSDFFIFARDNAADPDVIGNIGANILKSYDIEIDYPGRKAKIYLQDHCPGHVVSWPHRELAEIPFSLNKVGHISLPVTLDGHDYRALLDTGATASYVDKKVADRDFGLSAETANAMGTSDTLDGKDLPTFYHRFDVLDLGGLQFRRSPLAFSTGQENHVKAGWKQEEMPSLILGMHQLRGLHFYIAYGEKMIYASVSPNPEVLPLDGIDQIDLSRLTAAAEKQLAAQNYAEAADSLTRALHIAPSEPSLHVARAFVLLQTGDLAAVLADLDKAHELAPNDPSILSARAFARQQSGDFPAAIADLDDVIRLNPQSAEALAGRCSLKIQIHQLDAAFADCEQSLALDAKQEEARLNRVYLYMQRKQWGLAQAECNLVLADDPKSAPALGYLDQIRQAGADKRKGKTAAATK